MVSGEGSTIKNFMACTVHLVRMIKSRRLRWAGRVVRMGESRSAFKILTGAPAGNSYPYEELS